MNTYQSTESTGWTTVVESGLFVMALQHARFLHGGYRRGKRVTSKRVSS